MIISSPLIPTIGLGVDNSTPEASDSRVRVPNVYNPVFEPSLPLSVAGSFTTPTESSFIVNSILARVNQVAGSQPIITLARGMWDITFNIVSRFNYTGTGLPSNPDVSVLFANGVFTSVLWGIMASISSQSHVYVLRFLNQHPALQLIHFVGATGVGQNLDSYISVIGRKIL